MADSRLRLPWVPAECPAQTTPIQQARYLPLSLGGRLPSHAFGIQFVTPLYARLRLKPPYHVRYTSSKDTPVLGSLTAEHDIARHAADACR